MEVFSKGRSGSVMIKDLAARGAGVSGGLFGKKKEVEQSVPSRLSVRDEKPKVPAASESFC